MYVIVGMFVLGQLKRVTPTNCPEKSKPDPIKWHRARPHFSNHFGV